MLPHYHRHAASILCCDTSRSNTLLVRKLEYPFIQQHPRVPRNDSDCDLFVQTSFSIRVNLYRHATCKLFLALIRTSQVVSYDNPAKKESERKLVTGIPIKMKVRHTRSQYEHWLSQAETVVGELLAYDDSGFGQLCGELADASSNLGSIYHPFSSAMDTTAKRRSACDGFFPLLIVAKNTMDVCSRGMHDHGCRKHDFQMCKTQFFCVFYHLKCPFARALPPSRTPRS
jgi:hypothetical protein